MPTYHIFHANVYLAITVESSVKADNVRGVAFVQNFKLSYDLMSNFRLNFQTDQLTCVERMLIKTAEYKSPNQTHFTCHGCLTWYVDDFAYNTSIASSKLFQIHEIIWREHSHFLFLIQKVFQSIALLVVQIQTFQGSLQVVDCNII